MDVLIDKKCSCNEKDYFIFVSVHRNCDRSFIPIFTHAECERIIIVNFISMNCKCIRVKHEFVITDIDDYQFISDAIKNANQYGKFPGKIKGIILDVFGLCPFKKQYSFCEFWKTFAENHRIRYKFINSTTLKITSILYGVKSSLNNEKITLIHVKNDQSDVFILEPTVNGYVIKDRYRYGMMDLDKDCFKWIMRKNDFGKDDIILISMENPSTSSTKKYQKLFKPIKVVSLPKHYSNYFLDSLKLLIKRLNGISKNANIKVLPYFENDLWVIKKQCSLNFEGNFEIICKKYATQLSFSQTVNVYVSADEVVSLCYWNVRRYESLESYDLSKYKGSYIQITLTINANGFCNLNIQKLENPKIIPSLDNKEIDIQLYFDENGANIHSKIGVFCDENDDSTVPPYISFFDGLVIGAKAKQLVAQHPTFVVQGGPFKISRRFSSANDILTLLKMANNSNNNIKINPKWGFQVEKDSKGIMQIIFDTWLGRRKATPAFLLAILISHSLKIAQSYIGFRPTVFVFHSWKNLKIVGNQIFDVLKILGFNAKIDKMDEEKYEYIKVEKIFALGE